MLKKKEEAFTQFLKTMGSCLRGVAPGVLTAAASVSEEAFVAAVSAFLCGFDSHQPGNPEAIRACLDALAQSHYAAASARRLHG